jgi:hypothetical protein
MPKITKKQIAEALQGSVKKWERIVRSTRAKDKHGDNCPLCVVMESKETCSLCPVAINTGEDQCFGTPYTDWKAHQRLKHDNWSVFSRTPHCPDCLRLAKEELAFLKSLKV